jgi:hypothetical protein
MPFADSPAAAGSLFGGRYGSRRSGKRRALAVALVEERFFWPSSDDEAKAKAADENTNKPSDDGEDAP